MFRSKDGINFEEVSKVDGSGTTNTQHNYSFTDNNPYKGVSYYRLKQTDFNGDYTFSQIENVLITDGDIKYLVYPNPNNGNFSVKFDAEQNVNAVFLITDATGRLIQSGRLDDLSGKQQINIEKVLPGFYFLQITNGDNSYLAKVQVIK
ncbi:MAG: T9SS type A sorting domain-containing protein [Bacteroidota bacterium]|nr:MAG: T9SS type A sorting domain-containing protein [Bacteroidota bacterium]